MNDIRRKRQDREVHRHEPQINRVLLAEVRRVRELHIANFHMPAIRIQPEMPKMEVRLRNAGRNRVRDSARDRSNPERQEKDNHNQAKQNPAQYL